MKDKYGPGSPYDCATRAAREATTPDEKAAAFEKAGLEAIERLVRLNGWLGPDKTEHWE